MDDKFKSTIKGYEVKNVIEGIGHDMAGFKASLYKDGKKIAIVQDDGYGGCMDFHFNSRVLEEEYYNFIKGEKSLRAETFVPKTDIEKQVGFIFDGEVFANILVNKFNEIKDFKSFCRQGIAIQIGDEVGGDRYKIFKGLSYKLDSATFEELLVKKYPNQKYLILNKEMGIN